MSSIEPPHPPGLSFQRPVPLNPLAIPPTPTPPPSPIPYTTFTVREKRLIASLLGFTSLASPLTATIYLPIIPLLSAHFHASTQAINLTITLYIIFQALSPAVFATLSDTLGRRPIFLITLTLYFLASLGLSLNKQSYAALLVLRALQSLGASAILAVGYGVIADVCVPAERGKMQGIFLAAGNLGPCIGPVIGGWVALRSGSLEWVFWCLVIFGGVALTAIGWIFPETGRNVVGNGSMEAQGWRKTWWTTIRDHAGKRRETISAGEGEGDRGGSEESGKSKKRRFRIANPLACLRIIFWKDTALVLWISASFYAIWYCIQASIPSIYKDIYNFNEIEIGLSYLTGGAGVILGGFATGRIMDRNYKITAQQIGHTIDRIKGDDLNHFPIERARSRGSRYLLGVFVCALAGYGWAVKYHAHPSIPLILQCMIGFLCTCFLQVFNALLVDIFPESPSTAAASGNITRCALSALAIAVLQPLVDRLGRGWYFTSLSIVGGIGSAAAVWVVQKWGMMWRSQRLSRTSRSQPIQMTTEADRTRKFDEKDEISAC
ncbi:hypothetical protein MMC07_006905 [Pseudocyphellaria aurata]|nr:hypothetical protein [Pseudocyphellaria aurata]